MQFHEIIDTKIIFKINILPFPYIIALDEYKKCHEEWNDLNKKQEKLELKFNMTQDYLNTCQEASTNLSFLVVLPWFILGKYSYNLYFLHVEKTSEKIQNFKISVQNVIFSNFP